MVLTDGYSESLFDAFLTWVLVDLAGWFASLGIWLDVANVILVTLGIVVTFWIATHTTPRRDLQNIRLGYEAAVAAEKLGHIDAQIAALSYASHAARRVKRRYFAAGGYWWPVAIGAAVGVGWWLLMTPVAASHSASLLNLLIFSVAGAVAYGLLAALFEWLESIYTARWGN
ncbi:hypothetical protein [Agromyces mangrovi Wang et al. 2018]|uniref:hypothetical protein n=1 Tax=Agromyces mangrovi TaxID=1858653 RepID=UPI002573603F|nr:hypothetical protein [Agromyces mangrovi]BDZ64362.1 hypothetical protein GCM10025877_13000 [Agromyces mangrovi]